MKRKELKVISANRVTPMLLVFQFIIALLLGTGVYYVLRLINPVVSQIVLVLLLSLVFFIAMSIFRARWFMRQAQRDSHRDYRNRRGNDGPDTGRGGSGVREPRRPLRPYSPSRAIARDPDRED